MGKVLENAWESLKNFFENLGKDADVIIVSIVKIAGVLVLAKFTIILIRHIIKKVLAKGRKKKPFSQAARKAETIESVSASIARYVVYFFAVATILGIIGLGTTVNSLLATAGIGGVAIAFGAQSLVKDVVSGMFMLFEGQYSVGEYIEIDGEKGTVEAITIRTTSIRRFTGEVMTMPNGNISKITNYSRADLLAVVDMPLSYEADIEKASLIMRSVGLEYMEKHDNILEEPHVLGIIELSGSGLVLRMIVRVKPLTHWETERDLRRLIKMEFEAQGVETGVSQKVKYILG